MLGQLASYETHIEEYVEAIENIDPHLLLHTLLPVLLFESAFTLDHHIFKKSLGSILCLAIPGVLLATFLTSLVRFFLPYDWGWIQALLIGSILSATDPVAVVALLRELGASPVLSTLIEGESLLNDGSAIVVFIVLKELFLIDIDPSEEIDIDAVSIFSKFLYVGGVGPLVGIFFGKITVFWLKYVYNDYVVEISTTLTATYLTFYTAEEFLGVSGVLAVVALGLYMNVYGRTTVTHEIEHFMHIFYSMLGYLANTIIFILCGIITLRKSTFSGEDFGTLFILYIWLHIVRGTVVMVFYPIMHHLGYGLTLNQAIVMIYGGLRGAVGLALALVVSLEATDDEEYAEEVLKMTAGIVTLTLVINGSTVKLLLNALGMTKMDISKLDSLRYSIEHLKQQMKKKVSSLQHDNFLSDANWNQVRAWAFQPETPEMPALDLDHIEEEEEAFEKSIRKETIKRVLNAQKQSYWHQMEEGLISQKEILVLLELTDSALDTCMYMVDFDAIEKAVQMPEWLKNTYNRTRNWPIVGSLMRRKIFEHLFFAFRVGIGYMRASRVVEAMVLNLEETISHHHDYTHDAMVAAAAAALEEEEDSTDSEIEDGEVRDDPLHHKNGELKHLKPLIHPSPKASPRNSKLGIKRLDHLLPTTNEGSTNNEPTAVRQSLIPRSPKPTARASNLHLFANAMGKSKDSPANKEGSPVKGPLKVRAKGKSNDGSPVLMALDETATDTSLHNNSISLVKPISLPLNTPVSQRTSKKSVTTTPTSRSSQATSVGKTKTQFNIFGRKSSVMFNRRTSLTELKKGLGSMHMPLRSFKVHRQSTFHKIHTNAHRPFAIVSEVSLSEEIREHSVDNQNKTLAYLYTLRKAYPDISSAIKSFIASHTLLNYETRVIKTLIHKGSLEEDDGEKLILGVQECQKRLRVLPPPITPPDNTELFCRIPWMSDKSFSRNKLGKSLEELVLSEGKFLFKQGDPCDGIYLIVQGVARVQTKGKLLAMVGPGQVFGELAALTNALRSADVVADTYLIALRLSSDALDDLFMEDSSIHRDVWKHASIKLATHRLRASKLFPAWSERRLQLWCHNGEFLQLDDIDEELGSVREVTEFLVVVISGDCELVEDNDVPTNLQNTELTAANGVFFGDCIMKLKPVSSIVKPKLLYFEQMPLDVPEIDEKFQHHDDDKQLGRLHREVHVLDRHHAAKVDEDHALMSPQSISSTCAGLHYDDRKSEAALELMKEMNGMSSNGNDEHRLSKNNTVNPNTMSPKTKMRLLDTENDQSHQIRSTAPASGYVRSRKHTNSSRHPHHQKGSTTPRGNSTSGNHHHAVSPSIFNATHGDELESFTNKHHDIFAASHGHGHGHHHDEHDPHHAHGHGHGQSQTQTQSHAKTVSLSHVGNDRGSDALSKPTKSHKMKKTHTLRAVAGDMGEEVKDIEDEEDDLLQAVYGDESVVDPNTVKNYKKTKANKASVQNPKSGVSDRKANNTPLTKESIIDRTKSSKHILFQSVMQSEKYPASADLMNAESVTESGDVNKVEQSSDGRQGAAGGGQDGVAEFPKPLSKLELER